VRVYRRGLALLTAVSRPGLRLRRPDRAVHRVRVEQAAGQASPVTLSAARPVRRFVPVDGCAVPVWVESETLRRFSLQLEFVDVPQPGIRLFSHDLDLPLAVALGDPPGDAERKRCARRTWTWWPTPGAAPDTPFVVSTEGLPLLEGRLPSDTRLARCVADREASGRPVLGLRAYAAGVDPVHLRAAAGAGEWLVSPALDLSQPLARRQAMALIAGRAGNEAQR
jgi:hypothetical protein